MIIMNNIFRLNLSSYSEYGTIKYFYLIPQGKASTTCSVEYKKDSTETEPTITVIIDNC